MKKNELRSKDYLCVMVQGFYGNRTATEIRKEDFDLFMLGILDSSFNPEKEKIDRTIIKVPGAENVVIVYNKYQEEKALSRLQRYIREKDDGFSRFNPTACLPELGVVLYSRCIICRVGEDGELESFVGKEDFKKVEKYLAL